MQVHFVSSLTAEDENRVAEAVITAVKTLLVRVPLAYTIHIETMGRRVFQHSHFAGSEDQGAPMPDGADLSLIIPSLLAESSTEH